MAGVVRSADGRMKGAFSGRRRWWMVLLLVLLITVFAIMQTKWVARWMYPLYYYDDIRAEASQYDLDPLLVAAVARVESSFAEDRVSKVGAVGLMQLMPDTARWIVQQPGAPRVSPDDLKNPKVSLAMGTWYLNYLIHRFQGNEVAAVAAYNAGPNRVQEWLQAGKWDGTLDGADRIPVGETRHFVQRVFFMFDRYKEIY
ncbi:lytic transglycosylase domain-containing protein [Kyrpidia tusciae]|nr:lytic transglycosylase domain-containing protein [Kyrpidia tusciae]